MNDPDLRRLAEFPTLSILPGPVRREGRDSTESHTISHLQPPAPMRFLVMVKATPDSEAGKMPSTELLAAMGKYNEELVKAGVMLAGEGLQPSSKGARIKFSGTKRSVIDGPFAETKELIAGFWLWQCRSREEAIEW